MKATALLLFFGVFAQTIFASSINILEFGAKSDTTIVSTEAIQLAIDSCHKTGGGGGGGGVVIVPAGNFLTGTLILKSNVELHLTHGATLYGSKNKSDYLAIKPRYVALRTKEKTRQLIYAEDQKNIAITGSGSIDGQGAVFKKAEYDDAGTGRPHLLQFINCERVRVKDVSMRSSGAWMQHYLACEDVKITGVEIFNHANANNDGLDIDGCRNVTVSGLTIDSDDDAICLKSTSGKPCENISITNCVVSSHCNGLKLGTESSGGFMNITISNCVVKTSAVEDRHIFGYVKGVSGISVEMVDGGTLKGVNISNIHIDGTHSPIFIRLANRARPYSDTQGKIGVGTLSDVLLSDITISNAQDLGCSITGIPGHPVRNIRLSNISIEMAGGGTEEDFRRQVPEKEKAYPDAKMFGRLPAYGFFVRHATDVEMNNIRFEAKNPDFRPALYLHDVKQSSFHFLVFSGTTGGISPVFAEQSSDIVFNGCTVRGDTAVESLKQKDCENIQWVN